MGSSRNLWLLKCNYPPEPALGVRFLCSCLTTSDRDWSLSGRREDRGSCPGTEETAGSGAYFTLSCVEGASEVVGAGAWITAQGQRRTGMNPEEYLDRLIERRAHAEVQLPVTNSEVTVSLAAAEVLAQLQGIDVSPAFAGQLELHIRARARSLAQQNDRTIPYRYVRSNAMKIMVADHDRHMVDILSFWLKGHGYDVVRA